MGFHTQLNLRLCANRTVPVALKLPDALQAGNRSNFNCFLQKLPFRLFYIGRGWGAMTRGSEGKFGAVAASSANSRPWRFRFHLATNAGESHTAAPAVRSVPVNLNNWFTLRGIDDCSIVPHLPEAAYVYRRLSEFSCRNGRIVSVN